MTVTTTPLTGLDYDLLKAQIASFWVKQEPLSPIDKDWDESLHPRDEAGRFTDSEGGGRPRWDPEGDVNHGGAATSGPRSPELLASLRHVEANLAELPNNREREGTGHEEIYVLDKNGKVLYEGKGAEHTADVPDDKKHLLQGAVVTHNHPGWHLRSAYPGDQGPFYQGSGLSDQDITFAAHHGVAEVRAVTEGFIYSIRPGRGNDWPEYQTLLKSLRSVDERVKAINWGLIGEGKRSILEASIEHGNQKGALLEQELGLRYEVTAR